MMAQNKCGRGTARSTPWGSPSPLVKAQDGETGRSMDWGNPVDDGKAPEDPRGPRLFRFGSYNIGSMTGKSIELVNVLVKRKVNVCCVQETRWKGAGVRMLKGFGGLKYKFIWQGGLDGRNDVGLMLLEELMDKVEKVVKVNERLMLVKLVNGKCYVNVISGYAPQVGRNQEEKESFWNGLHNLVQNIKKNETIVISRDMNRHVGKESDGYEVVHGGYGYGQRNAGGESVLEFCDAFELTVCGTQYKINANKLISYSSGCLHTTVDNLLIRG